MNSYFTELEYADLLISDIDKTIPLAIAHVSKTQFSVARYSGGCIYQRKRYIYNYQTDELIRDDVMKAVGKMRRAAKKAEKKPVEMDLF
jgi:hypothetical protein